MPRVAAIPQPTNNPEDLRASLAAVKDAVETLARQSRNTSNSAVRLSELEALGLIKIYSDGTLFSDILSRIEALDSP